MKKTLCCIFLFMPVLSVAKGHKPAKTADIMPKIEDATNYQFSLERNTYDYDSYYTPSISAIIGN